MVAWVRVGKTLAKLATVVDKFNSLLVFSANNQIPIIIQASIRGQSPLNM